MELPKTTSTPQDPFNVIDGVMRFPNAQQMVPVDRQIPHAKQYDLSNVNDVSELDQLLLDAFRKRAVIWSLDKSWSKEGDCYVAVFYSEIIPKKKAFVDTGSNEVKVVQDPNAVVVPNEVIKKVSAQEDAMFDEFLEAMKIIQEESTPDEELDGIEE